MIFLKIRLHFLPVMAIFTRPMLAESVYNFHIFDGLSLLLTASLLVLTGITALIWAGGIFLWASRIAKPTRSDYPSVAVIVAARNEEYCIRTCLEALLAQDYPAGLFEIYLVDDHSTDRTRDIATEIAAGKPGCLHILAAPDCPPDVGPKKNAIKYAIQQATSSILLFTDADCRVPCSWINSIINQYTDRTGAVAGAVLPKPRSGIRALLYRFERLLIHYTSASSIGWGSPASVNGGNLSYRRAAYDQAGGMKYLEIASGDDDLMIQAIARCGWDVQFAAGSHTVVEDLRLPTARQHVQATIRHQSTAGLYPVHWRLMFLLTIFSAGFFLFCLVLAIFSKIILAAVIAAFILRTVIDGVGLFRFTKKLGIHTPAAGFFFSEICLPFYLALRPLLTIAPGFSWRDRMHKKHNV
ncbi:glycosyltransferase [candidate division KSB1 bacterium]|nr:MAG: glycosyltransferase [candidate division KSB1 bacterium]